MNHFQDYQNELQLTTQNCTKFGARPATAGQLLECPRQMNLASGFRQAIADARHVFNGAVSHMIQTPMSRVVLLFLYCLFAAVSLAASCQQLILQLFQNILGFQMRLWWKIFCDWGFPREV